VPIDFDGNWPEMNLRPSAAFLRGVSVSPLSLGLGLPRVVAFPLLLLNSTNSDLEATRLFVLVWESLTGRAVLALCISHGAYGIWSNCWPKIPGIWPKMPKIPSIWPKMPKSHTTLAGENDQNYHSVNWYYLSSAHPDPEWFSGRP
jgi:hypothetical protein